MIIPETEYCYELPVRECGWASLEIGNGTAVDMEQAQQLIIVLQRWIDGEDIED
ncbi:hypothetical protein [Pectobacterium parmentieri]|uniref:hypothetical protein n=1 Tax=Pectobacterium parmentieri TaxID=1905730 RepID=UPI001600B869|nr:hypothetical protein [Pectobacterium parmentieri]